MPLSLSLSTIDRLAKPTSTRFGVIAAVSDPQIQAVADALDAIILGQEVKAVKTTDDIIDAGGSAVPTDEECNRGNKWLMRAQTTSGNRYTFEIGTADNSQLPTPGTDFLDLTAGVGLAMKTAFDAAFEGKDGNTGVLLSIQQVNRNIN